MKLILSEDAYMLLLEVRLDKNSTNTKVEFPISFCITESLFVGNNLQYYVSGDIVTIIHPNPDIKETYIISCIEPSYLKKKVLVDITNLNVSTEIVTPFSENLEIYQTSTDFFKGDTLNLEKYREKSTLFFLLDDLYWTPSLYIQTDADEVSILISGEICTTEYNEDECFNLGETELLSIYRDGRKLQLETDYMIPLYFSSEKKDLQFSAPFTVSFSEKKYIYFVQQSKGLICTNMF